MYALINQLSLVRAKHPIKPSFDSEDVPMTRVKIYRPINQKRHWNTKLENPFKEGLIPNHPERHTNISTQAMLIASKNTFNDESTGALTQSDGDGIPKEKKSPQSNYNMSYKQVKVQNNERTKNENSEEIYINRDVNFDRYQQKIQVNDIIEKQNKYKKVVEDLRRGKCKNK